MTKEKVQNLLIESIKARLQNCIDDSIYVEDHSSSDFNSDLTTILYEAYDKIAKITTLDTVTKSK